MNENSYLIPANTKRSTLILNTLRWPIDVLIVGCGVVSTFVALMLLKDYRTLFVIIALIPASVCVILVLPIPNYHNTLCAIQSILNFYNNRRNFIWRGWCFRSEIENSK